MSDLTKLIYEGEIFRIEAYINKSNETLSIDWLEKQSEKCQSKFAVLFDRLANHGKIYNENKFKHLEGSNQIFEFKVNNTRVFSFFFFGKRVILTHGFIKKSRKTPKREIKRAENFKKEFEQRIKNEKN